MDGPILECVPNVSEGRDERFIKDLAKLISEQTGIDLLHVDSGYDANRTVYTFVGSPEAVVDAAYTLIEYCKGKIDMRQHEGSHPRIGAVDVCPLVPMRGLTLSEAADWAKVLGERVGRELEIPVYLYQAAASAPHRRNLARIRKGEYEGLASKMAESDWQPDFGPAVPSTDFGAAVIGARPYLIAYNIDLEPDTPLSVAKKLAALLRESGLRTKPGLFKGLKAIGWKQHSLGCCQVSTNVVDPDQVNLANLYRSCTRLARAEGYDTSGSQLIGLIPERYLFMAGLAFDPLARGERAFQTAVSGLGLDKRQPFDINRRILERAMCRPLGLI
ncbi:MAG: glutamate formimidoyltransferase [Bacteroidota bacterium]